MTKHNLHEHLRWLTTTRPQFPNAHAAIPDTFNIDTCPNSSPLQEECHSRDHQAAPPCSSDGNIITANAEVNPSDTEFQKPSIPASALNVSDKRFMAILQPKASSSNRHCLLTESNATSAKTPKSSSRISTAYLSETHQDAYNLRTPGLIWISRQ